MLAFLIDPSTKSITEVNYTGMLRDIYEHIGASLFCTYNLNSVGDTIYLDDEGLMNKKPFFKLEGCKNPLAGKGLVLGTDLQGVSISPVTETIESLEDKITFIGLKTAIRMAEAADRAGRNWAGTNPGHIYIPTAGLIKNAGYSEESETPDQETR